MNLNPIIIDALTATDVPVSFQEYIGEDTTYITFFLFDEYGSLFADDAEEQTAYYIQVDVWSKDDYTDLVEQVKSILKEKGFVRTNAIDLYENDTKIYHKAMRFIYTSSQD